MLLNVITMTECLLVLFIVGHTLNCHLSLLLCVECLRYHLCSDGDGDEVYFLTVAKQEKLLKDLYVL